MRAAMERWRSGGMTLSSVPTTAQLGRLFQAPGPAAEVFASFSRSGRVHAIAARIERHGTAWRMVALQIG